MESLREKVRAAYSAAATDPNGRHAFPVGREFATSLGYPTDWLAGVPSLSVDAFAGVSNVSLFAEIPPFATVLDLGCGAGLDSFVAARRTGSGGKVLGFDFSETMLGRARAAADESGMKNMLFCQADAEHMPVADGSVDIALVNGIFNLNPAREAIFRELARVLRTGGAVYAAELILREPLPEEARADETNWFA